MTMAKPVVKHTDIKDMTFERALKELETIVGRLERGDVELEESITIYERGEALKEHCDRLLKQAEAKVEKLTLGPRGRPHGYGALQASGVRLNLRRPFCRDPEPPLCLKHQDYNGLLPV